MAPVRRPHWRPEIIRGIRKNFTSIQPCFTNKFARLISIAAHDPDLLVHAAPLYESDLRSIGGDGREPTFVVEFAGRPSEQRDFPKTGSLNRRFWRVCHPQL